MVAKLLANKKNPEASSTNIAGVGLNLRLSCLDQVLKTKPDVDFWEVIAENFFDQPEKTEQLQEVAKHYPIHLHCIGHNIAGVDLVDTLYLKKINDLILQVQPRVVSDHLCFQKHQAKSHFDLLPFPLNEHSLERCIDRLNIIQDFYGRSVYVENLSYYIEFNSSTMTEVELLNQLVSSCQTKILLDLNNIEVNQTNLGHSRDEYLSQIDGHLVGEFHLAGATHSNQPVIDDHSGEPSKKSIGFLNTNPQFDHVPVCYERDTNIPQWAKLLEYTQQLKTQLKRN